MKALFLRELTESERGALRQGLRSREVLTLRRAQILLASADQQTPSQISRRVGCASQTVRNTIHAFEKEGAGCLAEKKRGPKDAQPILDEAKADPLKGILHQSPRRFGKARSTWTLDLLAEVAFEQELPPRRLSHEAVRQAVKRLGHGWKRAKQWITSPDPAYARKKKARDRLIRLAASHPEWVLGYQDECWWSRLALPAMHAWSDDPLRLVEREVPKGDTDPKALSCYGLLRGDTGRMMLRFVSGRPVSQVTEDYLGWVCERLKAEGKKALLLVWDNAAWHVSKRVRVWIKGHNRKARAEGGVRIVACFLPVKSPWLNPIEPKWAHGKRAIVEPDRLLAAVEVRTRVCDYYGCEHLEPLAQLSA
ncbi:IS630 family transposase [Gemmata sp. G18]|uniref:IS630 family transposase n=1 Tax=Gemmata palustris TaxID=2822762 RepID=A0ABS5BQT8_9BACT|nr:IS630 family transposase [Gemmata palustris]MBP3955333.1 IS630 family transposase [Gemmata palustris]MBP3955670.1 IS630 family transposase [Gemmata palustris]MBP3959722.1 IS630 family transposase [Gemmata palustris]